MLIQHLFQFGVSETNELFAPLRHTEIVHFGLDSGRILPSNPPTVYFSVPDGVLLFQKKIVRSFVPFSFLLKKRNKIDVC